MEGNEFYGTIIKLTFYQTFSNIEDTFILISFFRIPAQTSVTNPITHRDFFFPRLIPPPHPPSPPSTRGVAWVEWKKKKKINASTSNRNKTKLWLNKPSFVSRTRTIERKQSFQWNNNIMGKGVAGMCSISLYASRIAFRVARCGVHCVALSVCLSAPGEMAIAKIRHFLNIASICFMCMRLASPNQKFAPPSSISDMIHRWWVRAKKTTRMNYGSIVWMDVWYGSLEENRINVTLCK